MDQVIRLNTKGKWLNLVLAAGDTTMPSDGV